MALKYEQYLASNVLGDGNVVTFRSLSRDMQVPSVAARKMLHDFYEKQNLKAKGSVHATYLVLGLQRLQTVPSPGSKAKGHVDAQSMPLSSSPVPPQGQVSSPLLRVLSLAKEEDLEGLKKKYEHVSSFHIYSLEPVPIKNPGIIPESHEQLLLNNMNEDRLAFHRSYGVIQNAFVKRRKGETTINVVPQGIGGGSNHASANQQGKKLSVDDDQGSQSSASKTISPFESTSQNVEKKNGKQQLKQSKSKLREARGDYANLFKSFTKTTSDLGEQRNGDFATVDQRPSEESESAQSGITVTEPSGIHQARDEIEPEDIDEDEDQDMDSDDSVDAESGEELSNLRKERKEQLLKLMDDEDEAMPEAPAISPGEDEGLGDESSAPAQSKQEMKQEIQGGRRRGKRRVVKKLTMKDDEGYLITREESSWESFSEEEKASTAKSKPTMPSSQGKKGGSKAQGNIMSFFGRK